MATTKFSVSAYTADGVTTDYLITWDYLDSGHIAVYVDGTPNYDPQSTYSFELINSTTVRVTDEFGNAVPSGSEIEIRRETPILDRAVTFNDGSALLAEDLNKNSDYLLYSMQEVLDTVEAAAQDGALAAQVATEGLRDETTVLRDTTLGYKNEALAARDTTQTYLATVDADATAADNHRIAAAASEAAALASETAAAASQAASATSEANAAASEAASAASEAAAAASQAAALASENAAATSEVNAATSETAAQTAQAAAEAALDELTDLYLGAKATAPTVDNDGNTLQTGALYWNSTNDIMYVWNGGAWDTLNSTTGIADGATSAQVTLTDTLVSVTPDVDFGGAASFAGDVQVPNIAATGRVSSNSITTPIYSQSGVGTWLGGIASENGWSTETGIGGKTSYGTAWSLSSTPNRTYLSVGDPAQSGSLFTVWSVPHDNTRRLIWDTGGAQGVSTNFYADIDSTTRNVGTSWTLGRTWTNWGKKPNSYVILYMNVPARNDTTNWGGLYTDVQYSVNNGASWGSLGVTGYDGGIMDNGSYPIGHQNGYVLLSQADIYQSSQLKIRYLHRSYTGTTTINGSHDIQSGTSGMFWTTLMMHEIIG